MDSLIERHIPRADFIGLAAAFIGALFSVGGAIAEYVSLALVIEGSGGSIWPLRVFLLDWALVGIIDFIAAYFVFRWSSINWQQATWAFTGALIPLIILGAFSIGPLVLIAFILFVVSNVLFAVSRKPKWLASIGALALGIIINLGFLLLVITLANRSI